MSNAHSLQVVGIAPGHLRKCSREDFPLMSYLRTQKNLFAAPDSDNAEEPEPLPDAAELKRQNDERLEKILKEARIQLQQRSCAWEDTKRGEGSTEGSKPSGSDNLVLNGKEDKDSKPVEKRTETGAKTNSGSELPAAPSEDGEKKKSNGQQKGLKTDSTVNRQNALERLRRMEWQRNKTEALREPIQLHALPPKRDLAAEEADAAGEDARSKSKARNRRRSRQQQLSEKQQVVALVPAPPPPFPGADSHSSDVSPFWRSSKCTQDDGRTPFPSRVNVWLQRPGVDLFPKQPIPDSELEKVDELAIATEEMMVKRAVQASLRTAEEEGTILLPQPPRSTKSTYVQPPPLENEDWDADIAVSERDTAEKLSKNGTEEPACQEIVEPSYKNPDKSSIETNGKIDSVSSASKEYTDNKSVTSTANYSKRVQRIDNCATSWYQSSTKERIIRSKGDGKARDECDMEEKIAQWKKPVQKSELSTVSHRKNSEDRLKPESVNNKKIGIYNESFVARKENVHKDRWRSDWKNKINDFNEKLSFQKSDAGRKPEDTSVKYISDVTASELQAPKEQRIEPKRRNRQGSVQYSEDEERGDEVIASSKSGSDRGKNVRKVHFRNDSSSLTVNITIENSRNVNENSECDGAEGDQLNSDQNSFQSSFTNVCIKSANNKDLTVSTGAQGQTDSDAQINEIPRSVGWNTETENHSQQYEKKLHQERSSFNTQLQQQSQISNQEESTVTEKTCDTRDCISGRVPISTPPGLQCRDQQRNEQVSRGPDSTTKHNSESKPPEQESSVDEFFRKYALHNSTSGQPVRLSDGNFPMGAFRVGGSAPSLGMQPNCAQAPVIQGTTGVPPVHPSQIPVCGAPQMYQACGVVPDLGTGLQSSAYPYVYGTGQKPLLDNNAMLPSKSDCYPGANPQSTFRFGGTGSQRPTAEPVAQSLQSSEGVYPSYGLYTVEAGQQPHTGNHMGSLLKNGAMTGYGNIRATASMPLEVMMPGLGTTHPTVIPPPPGVYAYPAVTPLTGLSPPRCSQLQQGLVLQPMQVPQENIGERLVTPQQENSATPSVQDPRGNQVSSGGTQEIPQVPQAGGVSQNTVVASGNGETPAAQELSQNILNQSSKSQLPPSNIGNLNTQTMYSPVQPNDTNTFLALHQNGVADSQDAAVGMSQWPMYCYTQADMTQLQGAPQIVNVDGTVSHFPDVAQFGIPQPFKQPGTPLVDHIWYPGILPFLPVHDSVNVCRNNQTKQFGNIPDMRLDSQATVVPQMRVMHGPQMSQFGSESQQLNDHSQMYFPGISHVPAQTQLSTQSVNTVGHSSLPPGLPSQPPGLPSQPSFPQGTAQQQISFAQHPPGIMLTGMCQNVNSQTAGNAHRNVSAQLGTAAVLKGRNMSEYSASDGQNVDSKPVQKIPRSQSLQDGRYTFPGDGSLADISHVAEKLKQSSLSQHGSAQGMQTAATPQSTFQCVPPVSGSTPKAQLYYEKVQSLLCQPPDVINRLLQQMQLNASVAPVTDPSAGSSVGPQGFVVPPTAEVWPVVHNPQVVQERLNPSQSQGGFTVAARGRGKGRGRLRDIDG